jgi:hypothetical protein
MAAVGSEIDGYVTLALVLILVLFGLTILIFLRPRGGPEIAFARLLADSRRRTIFLAALCTSLAALFGIGLADTLAWIFGIPALEASVVRGALFAVGATGIFVLMRDALNTRPMTLAEEWNLKETAARVTIAPPAVSSPIVIPPAEYPADREARRPGR